MEVGDGGAGVSTCGFAPGSGSIRDVQTAAQMRERIPDWPWHRVDISEFKKAINEEDGDEDDRNEEDHCGEGVEHRYVKGSKEVSMSAEASKTTPTKFINDSTFT